MHNKIVFAFLLLFALKSGLCKLRSKSIQFKSHGNKISYFGNRTRYYSANLSDYLSVQNYTISIINCPEPNVIDQENGICYCQKGMANYPFDGYEGVYCQYVQKNQLTSFLWELLTGIGIGHFIIHQYVKGSFKLILCLFPFCIGILNLFGVIKSKNSEGASGLIISILFSLSLLSWSVWWLTDAIMFGLNKYRDSNAVPLTSWQ